MFHVEQSATSTNENGNTNDSHSALNDNGNRNANDSHSRPAANDNDNGNANESDSHSQINSKTYLGQIRMRTIRIHNITIS
jgi:hypothetical protein